MHTSLSISNKHFLSLLCFCLSFISANAQVRKFQNHEVLTLPNGSYIEVLVCRGEGASEVCDVIYYTGKRQNGKRVWKLADSIRADLQRPLATTTTSINDNSGSSSSIDVNNAIPVTPPLQIKSNAAEIYNPSEPAGQKNLVVFTGKGQKAGSEESTSTKEPSLIKDKISDTAKKLSVFVDCNTDCDMSYIKTELTLVDFFLDRMAADVHILVNEQSNGGGGSEVQFIFYGQQKFKDLQDTLRVEIPANSTAFERRKEILKGIKSGLFPFLLQTKYAKYVELSMKLPADSKASKSTSAKDPWNFWVFRLGLDGMLNTDQVYKSLQGNGYILVNRITDKTKLNFAVSGAYNRYEYKYDDNGINRTFEVLNSDYLFQHSFIESIGKHWGVGYLAAFSNSTFSNNKSRMYGKAAIEYSVFPYKDVNTRFFTISYGTDVRANAYYDTTIYFKTKEVLFGHVAQANLSLNQKWGTINSTLAYSNYFKDASLNNLSARLEFNFRITGGLSMYLYSSGARVRDQIYLVKGKASEQDVLTRRRQIASAYNFYSGMGINFRFGSKLNNFVNPRLASL